MKTYLYIVFSLMLIVSCTQKKASETGERMLAVTIEPQKFLLDKLTQGLFDVYCVVPSGSNPESFDISPSQFIKLEKSTVYFKLGKLSIENTLIEKVLHNNPQINVVDCSAGIESHECHSEAHHHEGNAGGHENGDPHIWSTPATALQMSKNMYDYLLNLDTLSSYRMQLESNFNSLENEISQTDSIIRRYVETAPSKSFVIYHPSLSYFAREYGLNQMAIENDGKQPSPASLKNLIDRAKENNVKVVFIQYEYDTKNAEIVAKAIGAKIVIINQLSYDWTSEMLKIARAISSEE